MRKVLLSLSMGVIALSASADVVTFLAADALSCPLLEAPQGKVVVLPEGFYFNVPKSRIPQQPVSKVVASDNIMLAGISTDDMQDSVFVTSGGLRWFENSTLEFTPAAGMTITKIRVRTQTETYTKQLPGFVFDSSSDFLQEWRGQSAEPMRVKATTGQNRCFWIEVTTTGISSQVAMPVISATNPAVGTDEAISFDCATSGATIHYTIDGTEPNVNSPVYTAPFKLEKDAIVRAIAIKDGMAQSFPSYNEYFVVPAGCTMAKYDFSDWKSLEKKDGTHYTDANLKYAGKNINLVINDVTFVSNGTSFHTLCSATPKKNYLYQSATFGGMVEYRTGQNTIMTIESSKGNIAAVVVAGSILTNVKAEDEAKGAFVPSKYNTSLAIWTPGEGVQTNKMSLLATAANQYIDQVYVYYKDPSGVDGVDADLTDKNAPVEYYNLQGVRVDNPSNGIYIKRQGANAVKVYVK